MPLQILLHSSKTMRQSSPNEPLDKPILLPNAEELICIWRGITVNQLKKLMKISDRKAIEVKEIFEHWSINSNKTPAIDAFIGDIYSGLQVQTWSKSDRRYAHEHLLILSGLYGGLRACDGIAPYRLEMGYKLPDGRSMYTYWADSITTLLTKNVNYIINLSAVEYTKALLPYIKTPSVTPKFLTVSQKTGIPTFVTVHTKVARGAFARWIVQNRVSDISELKNFSELNYQYSTTDSTPEQPVFICRKFGGLGLSVRLTE